MLRVVLYPTNDNNNNEDNHDDDDDDEGQTPRTSESDLI